MDTIEPQPARSPRWRLAFSLLVLTVIAALAQLAGPPLGVPIGSAFTPLAFALLFVLARMGDTDPSARGLGLLLLWATLTAVAMLSLALVVLHVVEPSSLRESADEIQFRDGGEARLTFMMVLLAISGSASVLALFRGVRVAVQDIIPIDTALYSHAIGLATAAATSLIPLLPLFVLGKAPLPIPPDALPAVNGNTALPTVTDRAFELSWFAVATLVAAGPGAGRSWRALCARLGLTRPTVVAAGTAVLAGVALAWIRPLVVSTLTSWLTAPRPAPDTDAWLPQGLPIPTALALSLAVASGTELTYRGFLQPRLGIVLASLLLTAQLAWTNNWPTLFVVFGVSLAFGLLRNTGGTIAAWLAHVTFLLGTAWRA